MNLVRRTIRVVALASFSFFFLSGLASAKKVKEGHLKKTMEAVVLYHIYGPKGLEMNQPSDLDLALNGDLYVLDGVNDRVLVFDSKGKYKFHFGKSGNGDGELNQPLGIGLDRSANVYVADSRNHRVVVFNREGKYLNTVLLKANPGSPLPDPADVEIVTPQDDDEVLWITDNDSHRVLVYDRYTLKFIKQFGGHGIEAGSFRYPFLMDSNDKGDVFIVDVLNTRVQAFRYSGKFFRELGYWAISEGGFYRPKGVTHSPYGDTIFVSDSYMGVIQGFEAGGSYKCTLANKDGSELKLMTPFGMVADRFGKLYVLEMLSNRVTVLRIK